MALVVAMGGTGYAALKLPAASVGTRQLKNRAVTGPKIKRGAITTAKLANGAVTGANVLANSLTGSNINVATLGKVPAATAADTATSAANANHATSSDSATSAGTAGALAGVVYAVNTSAGPVTVPKCASAPCTPDQVGTTFAIARCPDGMIAVGGGGVTADPGVELAGSFPTVSGGASGWEVDVDNYLQTPSSVAYYAVCVVINGIDVTGFARTARHAR